MINKVIIVGRVGRDPEVRTLQSGSVMCNLSVATSETWKDRHSGERREKTQWHRIVIFNNNLIEKFIQPYVKKGQLVGVEGQLEYRTWQAADGTDRVTAEIVIKQFVGDLKLLSSPSSNNDRYDNSSYERKPFEQKPFEQQPFDTFDDDENPF